MKRFFQKRSLLTIARHSRYRKKILNDPEVYRYFAESHMEWKSRESTLMGWYVWTDGEINQEVYEQDHRSVMQSWHTTNCWQLWVRSKWSWTSGNHLMYILKTWRNPSVQCTYWLVDEYSTCQTYMCLMVNKQGITTLQYPTWRMKHLDHVLDHIWLR